MHFTVIDASHPIPANAINQAFLITDKWDDWGKYRTQFFLIVVDEHGSRHEIGATKIGQVNLAPAPTVKAGQRAPEIPEKFSTLTDQFFSLGQSEDYYETLNQLSPELQEKIFNGLRDCAFNLQIFEANLHENVMTESLLRSVYKDNVRNRLNRLSKGDASLTEFRFNYTLPQPEGMPAAIMEFVVLPESQPPTNVHVLIGRNGVGKTRCIQQLVETLLGRESRYRGSPGSITLLPDNNGSTWSFSGLTLISFSAFDDLDLKPLQTDQLDFQQVGLRHRTEEQQAEVKPSTELAQDFSKSLQHCRQGRRAERWRAAIHTLETDDLFAEANIESLLDEPFENEVEDWTHRAESLFKRLSSGHAIVLLTVTRLVELVDEKTLVLLDEPEGHLHPPLLSAFIRCLSDLLVKRNGVAIIATHSPVVLQEVSRSCAWKLSRSSVLSKVERPTIETFGENIGLLTRDVFGLEVTRSGFHKLLSDSVLQGFSYEQVVDQFGNQLGAEAKAILRALIAERDNYKWDSDATPT